MKKKLTRKKRMTSKQRTQFVIDLLKKHTDLETSFLKKIVLNQTNRRLIDRAFVVIETNINENQEPLEFMGDAVFGHFLTKYTFKRFPWLTNHLKGVKTAARIKIVYGGKEFMSGLAEEIGIFDLINFPEGLDPPRSRIVDALEDTFESLCHIIEEIVDNTTGKTGLGFTVVYQVLSGIFQMVDISTKTKDLVDTKTLLKEQTDKNPDLKVRYLHRFNRDQDRNTVSLYINRQLITEQSHVMKKVAEKMAALEGLKHLNVDLDAL